MTTPGSRKWTTLGLCAVLLGMALLETGCLSTRQGKAQFVRGGVRYGVTDGTFRGRWWNYYDRGTSYLDGGFYDEAEADIRTAMVTHTREQLWPRTYGLHFMPEYFPHRELGIALYRKGDLDSAEREIEQSLAEQFSARAAFYLDEIRQQRIQAAGGDNEPPVFELTSQPGSAGSLEIELTGIARDNQFVAKVFVDDEPVVIRFSEPEIQVRHRVVLEPGENTVPVSVVDLAGNEIRTEFKLPADVDGPVVSLDRLPDRITGMVFDPSGLQEIEIMGQKITPNPQDMTKLVINLPAAAATAAGVPFRATDRMGNITAGEIGNAEVEPGAERLSRSGAFVLLPSFPYWLPAATSQMVLGATPAIAGPLRADMPGLKEGQEFASEVIVITMQVSTTSPAPIASVTLDGNPLPIVEGQKKVRVSRQRPLDLGENVLTLMATDTEGNQVTQEVRVSRVEVKPEKTAARLAVCFVGNLAASPDPAVEAIAQQVFDTLPSEEPLADRFEIVDRENLDDVLKELELSASELVTKKLAPGRIRAAEVLFGGRVRKDAETVEIVLEGVSTETGTRITSRVDVAGTADLVEDLIADLALRLVQEFPRAKGKILDSSADSFTTNLGILNGMQNAYKCVIYRPEPVVEDGVVRGYKPSKPVFEGILDGVDDAFSTGVLLPNSDPAAPDYTIQVDDVVQAK